MQSTTTLDLNLQYPNRLTTMYAVQNDRMTRKITANLFVGSDPFTPPSGAAAMIRFHKPDGTNGFYDVDDDGNTAVTWSGNVATIMLAEQALTCPGDVICHLQFYTGDVERLTTFSWIIKVEECLPTDEGFMSTDYYNILSIQIAAILDVIADIPVPSTSDPLMDGTASPGTSATFARGDHRHPTDTTRASTATATTSANGLMSSSDKTKLNGIATGAEVNQNAFSNVKVGSTTVAADSKTDTLELAAGSNITLTPDATNDKVTIAASYTATTGKPTGNLTPSFGGTATISQVSQSATGQLSVTDRTITIPNTSASGSTKGLVTLSDSTSSTSGASDGVAATPKAVNELNGAITYVVEVSDTQPSSTYNEIWIPATATPTVEIPTVAELNAVADPEVENLSATVTFTTGAKGTLYKKGFVYRVDVGIQTRTEFTPASNSMVTLGTLPSAARMSGSVYVPAVYRSNNSDPLTATYAGIYANGNIAIFVNTTSPIYLAMVAIGFTYFRF